MSDLNPYEEGLALELQAAQKRIEALIEQLDAAQAREAALPDIVAVLTDAAAVAMKSREAALQDAAEVAKSWYRQWAMYSGDNEPTRDDRAGGITYGRLQGAETIAAAILALIGEARE